MIPAEKPIKIDLFAGGGGVACAMVMATGSGPDVAVNHDPKAVAMHAINHPGTLHVCQDVWGCPPQWAARGRKVAWLHGSPDCTHFSKAKGSAPNRDEKRRDLAWVLVKWIRELLPNCVSLENVEEFLTWGPCNHAGIPIASQAGASFRSFVAAIRRLGYKVEWRQLRACDYGAPTIRKRLFLIARRDGRAHCVAHANARPRPRPAIPYGGGVHRLQPPLPLDLRAQTAAGRSHAAPHCRGHQALRCRGRAAVHRQPNSRWTPGEPGRAHAHGDGRTPWGKGHGGTVHRLPKP